MRRYIYDIESFFHYCIIQFKEVNKDNWFLMDESNYQEFLEDLELDLKAKRLLLIGYNNENYDKRVLYYLIKNKHMPYKQLCLKAKEMTNMIINGCSPYLFNMKEIYSCEFCSASPKWGCQDCQESVNEFYAPNYFYQIDLMDFTKGGSLKEWGVKLHYPLLEEMPIHPDILHISDDQKEKIKFYCRNDVLVAEKIYNQFIENVELRINLVNKLFPNQWNLLEESDRAITEKYLSDPNIKQDKSSFRYIPPIDFNFKTKELQHLLETIKSIDFSGTEYSQFSQDLELWGMKVTVALGGIHGAINTSYFENVIDLDFTSYYPILMIAFGFAPRTMKDINQFIEMLEERVRLKKDNPLLASIYKVLINTIYGAMGYMTKSKRGGKLFDLKHMYHVTLTGQLLLLKFCELLDEFGYKIVYLNTDGVSFIDNKTNKYQEVVKYFEKTINSPLKDVPLMEKKIFSKIWYRDVNNYIGLYSDDSINGKDANKLKIKGVYDYSPESRSHARMMICYKAIIDYLTKGISFEDTINKSNDIRDFILYWKFSSQYVQTRGYKLREKIQILNDIELYRQLKNNARDDQTIELLKHGKIRTVNTKGDIGKEELISNYSIRKIKIPESMGERNKFYNEYLKKWEKYIIENKYSEAKEVKSVCRYVLGNEKTDCYLFSINSNNMTPASKELTDKIILVNNLDDFDISQIDRKRYIMETYKIYQDLTNKEIENNPYIENILKKLDEVF